MIKFSPQDLLVMPGGEQVISTLDWLALLIVTIASFAFFVISGLRIREADAIGAFFSFFSGVTVLIAYSIMFDIFVV